MPIPHRAFLRCSLDERVYSAARMFTGAIAHLPIRLARFAHSGNRQSKEIDSRR
jgi:hypothetical protein